MNEQRNLFVAIILVVGILFGFQYFYEHPKALEQQKAFETAQKLEVAAPQAVVLPLNATQSREEALKQSQRIVIETDKVKGTINLLGGVIDDLSLTQYQETTDVDSKAVELLTPGNAKNAYFGAFGWSFIDKAATQKLPAADTLWKTSSNTLKVGAPITLTHTNGDGLIFERVIEIDENYMFKVTDKIINRTQQTINLKHTAMIERHDAGVSAQGGFILHEGAIGVIGSKLYEVDYEDLKEQPKARETYFEGVQKSWLGFTDKYWLTALIPDVAKQTNLSFVGDHDKKLYRVMAESQPLQIPAGSETSITNHFYAGAKILELLDLYEAKLGFDKFDLAIDFGWFYFLTKPLHYALKFMNGLLGNFGIAILVITILMKILFFPLANKSYRSMSRMRTMQPKIQALQERYASDRMKLNQAMMELYQKEKINPMSGCLPMIIQAPIFFCLYKVLYVSLEMRHAPFYGWVHDLSAPDPTSILNLFGLLPFHAPDFAHIGAWPIIMGVTMWLQQKLNPQPADKAQAMMFMIMPLFLTFLFATFPAGLVIYWTWSNVLGIAQQWTIMRMEASRTAAIQK